MAPINKCGRWQVDIGCVHEEKLYEAMTLEANKVLFVSSAWRQTDALVAQCAPSEMLRVNPGRFLGQSALECFEGIHRFPLFNQGIAYEADVIADAMTIGLDEVRLVVLDVDPTHYVCSFDDKLRYVIATGLLMHRTGMYEGAHLDQEFIDWLRLKFQREPLDTDGNPVWEPEPVPENPGYEERLACIEGAVMRYDDRLRESFALTFSAVCRLLSVASS